MLIQCIWSLVRVLIWLPSMKPHAAPLAVGDGCSPEMQLEALCGSFWMPSLQGWVLVAPSSLIISRRRDDGHVGVGRGPGLWGPQPHLGQPTWTPH